MGNDCPELNTVPIEGTGTSWRLATRSGPRRRAWERADPPCDPNVVGDEGVSVKTATPTDHGLGRNWNRRRRRSAATSSGEAGYEPWEGQRWSDSTRRYPRSAGGNNYVSRVDDEGVRFEQSAEVSVCVV